MAISKVGLGWPVGERDFDSLPAFIAAMGSTGSFETANCKGNLGSTTSIIQTGGFGNGLLITSDTKYTGNNHLDLAFFDGPLYFTNTNPNITIEHIAHYCSVNQYALRLIRAHTVRDCYAKKLAVSTTTPMYDVGLATAQRLVIDCNNLATFALRNNTTALVSNIVAFNSSNRSIQVPAAGSVGFVQNSFSFGAALSGYFWTGAAASNNRLINSASESTGDYSGNITGYTSAELVNFAAGDYRIKSTSDLKALGIGAFFEESGIIPIAFTGTIPNLSISVGDTVNIDLNVYFSGSETPFVITSIGASLAAIGLSIVAGVIVGTATVGGIVGAQVRGTDAALNTADSNLFNVTVAAAAVESTVALTWPLFAVSANQQSTVPVYESAVTVAWPLFQVAATQSGEAPTVASSVAFDWPLFQVTATQQSSVPVYNSAVDVTWPLFSVSAAQQFTPVGATSVAITWPMFNVSASQQSTVPVFGSDVALSWPLFAVAAEQSQDLPTGASVVAIEWPLFTVNADTQSTVPQYQSTVALTWPLFSVSVVAGEFDYYASTTARIDLPRLSNRIDLPRLSNRIDAPRLSNRIDL